MSFPPSERRVRNACGAANLSDRVGSLAAKLERAIVVASAALLLRFLESNMAVECGPIELEGSGGQEVVYDNIRSPVEPVAPIVLNLC